MDDRSSTDPTAPSPLNVLLISPMYPSPSHPSFGAFIARLETAVRGKGGVQYLYAVRTRPRDTFVAKLASYLSWAVRTLWVGLRGNYQLVHAHTLFPGGTLGAAVACLRGVPLITSLHGSDVVLLHRRPGFVRRMARATLRRSDMVHAVSQFLANQASAIEPLAPSNFLVQSIGVDMGAIREALEGTASSPGSTRRLLFVGNLVELKGWRLALETLRELRRCGKDWRLDVYGSGPDADKAREWIAKEGLDGWVALHGERPHHEVLQAMANSDVFIAPSVGAEGFGLAPAEALAMGVPVAVSARGALPELVRGVSCTEVVETPLEAKAFAQACERLLAASSRGSGRSGILPDRHRLDHAASVLRDRYFECVLASDNEWE